MTKRKPLFLRDDFTNLASSSVVQSATYIYILMFIREIALPLGTVLKVRWSLVMLCLTDIVPNSVLTIFHTQNICHHAWKTVRTILQCIVGVQSRGEGHKK